jgi:hypothetical protein
MKKKISTYWPVAMLLPIALAFCMADEGRLAAKDRERIGVEDVSAELARAISFGLIDTKKVEPVRLPSPKTL